MYKGYNMKSNTFHLEFELYSNQYGQSKDVLLSQVEEFYDYVKDNVTPSDINIRLKRIASYNDYVKGIEVSSLVWSLSGLVIVVDYTLAASTDKNTESFLCKVILDALNAVSEVVGVNLVVIPVREGKSVDSVSLIVNRILEGADIRQLIFKVVG